MHGVGMVWCSLCCKDGILKGKGQEDKRSKSQNVERSKSRGMHRVGMVWCSLCCKDGILKGKGQEDKRSKSRKVEKSGCAVG